MKDIAIVKKKLKSPLPMKGVESKIYLAVVMLVVSGIALSISLEDWQYFERTGSLIVIVGIAITWRDLTGRINWAREYSKNHIDKQLASLESKSSKGIIPSLHVSDAKENLQDFSKDLDELFKTLRGRLRALEAVVLISGTFIWGYGTILGSLIYNFHT